MNNELGRIGAIIYDLKRNVNPLSSAQDLDFLEDEFNRIALALGAMCNERVAGLPDLLEFHRAETLRFAEIIDDLIIASISKMTHEDMLTKIYDEMLTQLKELLRRINLMIGRKSVDIN